MTVVAAIVMGTYYWASANIPTIPEPPPSASGVTGPVDIAGRCDERACNYLLLGSDSRKGLTEEEIIAFGDDAHIGGENRSDTIILVHTRPDRREVVFVRSPATCGSRTSPGWVRGGSTRRSRAGSTAVALSASPGR